MLRYVFIIFSHKNMQDFPRKPGEGDFDNKENYKNTSL